MEQVGVTCPQGTMNVVREEAADGCPDTHPAWLSLP